MYFGFGANRERDVISAITGNENLVGVQAILRDFSLAVQRLDQIPEGVQKILRGVWNEGFTSYVIIPKRGSQIDGIVWELTPKERELVKDFELIDLGWTEETTGEAIFENGMGVMVVTERVAGGQMLDHEVDGSNYPPYLNNREDVLRIAEQSRLEYLARIETESRSSRVESE